MNNFIVTFGQKHTHRVNGVTFDKDSVAVIEAEDYGKAREIAFELFGPKFCMMHDEEAYDMKNMGDYFPRGKFKANNPEGSFQ